MQQNRKLYNVESLLAVTQPCEENDWWNYNYANITLWNQPTGWKNKIIACSPKYWVHIIDNKLKGRLLVVLANSVWVHMYVCVCVVWRLITIDSTVKFRFATVVGFSKNSSLNSNHHFTGEHSMYVLLNLRPETLPLLIENGNWMLMYWEPLAEGMFRQYFN